MFNNSFASILNPGFAGPSQGYMQMLSSIMGGMGNMLPAAPTRQYNLANEWDKIIGMAQGQKSIYDQLMLFGSAMSSAPTWGQGMAQVAQGMAAEKQREKELMLQLRLGKMESLQKQEEQDFNRQTALAGLGMNIADKSYNAFNLDRTYTADREDKSRMFELDKARTQATVAQALASAAASGSTTALNQEKLSQLKSQYESAEKRQQKREAGVFRVPDAQLDIDGMRIEAAVDTALGEMEARGEAVLDDKGKLTPAAHSAQVAAVNAMQQKIVQEKMAMMPQRGGGNPMGQLLSGGARGLADLSLANPGAVPGYLQNLGQLGQQFGLGGSAAGVEFVQDPSGKKGIRVNGKFYEVPGLE